MPVKRLVIIAACALAGFGIYRLAMLFVPEETRIRQLMETMVEAFNDRDAGDCAAGLADDFREETVKLGKPEVHALLVHLFFAQRDSRTGEVPYRIEVPPESLRVTLGPGGGEAKVELIARFLEDRGKGARPVWEAAISADIVKVDGEWRVKRSSHESASGKRPF